MTLNKSTIIFWLIFVGIFLCIFLMGCSTTIPETPKRENDLPRQCNLLIHKCSKDLSEYLLSINAPIERQDDAQAILKSSEALLEWFGYPEDPFTGNPLKLAEQMIQADQEYDREVSQWVQDVSKHEGDSVGGSPIGGYVFKSLLFIVIVSAIGLVLAFKILL